jgi:uncharacterized protein (DUF697 family)
MARRGIVITPQFDFDGHALQLKGGFDPVSLRQYLLYWDKIDWPDNNIISIGESDDDGMAFLKSEGILERTMVQFSSFHGNIGNAMLDMQVLALDLRNEREPGAWSLAQQSAHLASTETGTSVARSIEVELYSALPIPSSDVPFESIIEFKERRSDELLNFRSTMDELYQQVVASADIPRAKLQAIVKVQRSLQDLNNVFGESFSQRVLGSLKIELNLPNVAVLAAAGAASASTFGIPLAIGAAAGAIAASVKFDLTHIRKSRSIPDSLRDYAYLHYIPRELL